MDKIYGKRLHFDKEEEGIYSAIIGNGRWAFLVQDRLGWRALLLSPNAMNPAGLYVARDVWRPQSLRTAVLDLERMIDAAGLPKLGRRDEKGVPDWYGETAMLTGPLLDGTGDWMKICSKVVTFPKGKRRKLIPGVGRVPFHPVVAELQASGCALAFHVRRLREAIRLDCHLLVEARKRSVSASLGKLLGLIQKAEAQHIPWRCPDIMHRENVEFVDAARATGQVTVTVRA
jgi:hypothetical protein